MSCMKNRMRSSIPILHTNAASWSRVRMMRRAWTSHRIAHAPTHTKTTRTRTTRTRTAIHTCWNHMGNHRNSSFHMRNHRTSPIRNRRHRPSRRTRRHHSASWHACVRLRPHVFSNQSARRESRQGTGWASYRWLAPIARARPHASHTGDASRG